MTGCDVAGAEVLTHGGGATDVPLASKICSTLIIVMMHSYTHTYHTMHQVSNTSVYDIGYTMQGVTCGLHGFKYIYI